MKRNALFVTTID